MTILVTGKNGQLGSELHDLSVNYPHYNFIFVGKKEIELSNQYEIKQKLTDYEPDIIVNCGAYTAVDKAETDVLLCNAINHLAVQTIGEWAKDKNSKVIHISTDYVFSGDDNAPLNETASTNPINVYGKTKLLGEEALKKSGCAYVIIRTAWVYSAYGANFVKTMVRLMAEKDTLNVIDDQIGSPTYAHDLAKAIMKIIDNECFTQGVFHYSNAGRISWWEFAQKIKELKGFSCKLNAISSAMYPTAARRPNFSLLDKAKIQQIYNVEVPFWETSLQTMLKKLQ